MYIHCTFNAIKVTTSWWHNSVWSWSSPNYSTGGMRDKESLNLWPNTIAKDLHSRNLYNKMKESIVVQRMRKEKVLLVSIFSIHNTHSHWHTCVSCTLIGIFIKSKLVVSPLSSIASDSVWIIIAPSLSHFYIVKRVVQVLEIECCR